MKTLLLILLFSLILIYINYSQWVEVTPPTTSELYTISVVDDTTAWVCAKYNNIYRTTNGGINYSDVGSFSNNQINSIYALNANNAYVSIYDLSLHASRILYTTNGIWYYQNDYSNNIFTSIIMTSPTNGFAIGYDYNLSSTRWSLYKTTNGGSWDSIGLYVAKVSDEVCSPNNMFILGNNIWFTSSYHKIYYSSNNG